MDTVEKLLDNAREKCSPATDMALAARLGVVRSAVSNYRHGRAYPDAVVCARLSELTGQPLARVLGIVGEARALSRDEKQVWRRLAQTAVFALAALGLTGAPGPATAFDAGSYPQRDALYIMRNRWRRWLRAIFPRPLAT